jgi:hypothetical protein
MSRVTFPVLSESFFRQHGCHGGHFEEQQLLHFACLGCQPFSYLLYHRVFSHSLFRLQSYPQAVSVKYVLSNVLRVNFLLFSFFISKT